MKKITNKILMYAMWIIDLALALWFAILSRTALLEILPLFYDEKSWSGPRWAGVVDRVYTFGIGLAWLIFMIIVEEYYRAGVKKGNLLIRFAKVTGPVLLALFVVDLILIWLGGIRNSDWLRWILIAAELGLGTALIVWAKTRFTPKSP